MFSATAEACANIAFIKYWGNRGGDLNLPLNVSISMNLAVCVTRTRVEVAPEIASDTLMLNGAPAGNGPTSRASRFLDHVRRLTGRSEAARVVSENNFPTRCGIASSASGFAALACAAAAVFGLDADEKELSRLARLGSGSAARSVPGGFVELLPGETHGGAYARQIASETAWPDLRDLVVIVSDREKETPSSDGHSLARTSEMLAGRLAAVPSRADRVRRALLERNLAVLGEASEEDAVSMHAVMMTSRPPLFYWLPGTLEAMQIVRDLRSRGVEAYFTMDAGPNLHVLTLAGSLPVVEAEFQARMGCKMIASGPGPGTRILQKAPL